MSEKRPRSIAMTDEEWQEIKGGAKEAGVGIAAYILECVRSQISGVPTFSEESWEETGSHGVMVKGTREPFTQGEAEINRPRSVDPRNIAIDPNPDVDEIDIIPPAHTIDDCVAAVRHAGLMYSPITPTVLRDPGTTPNRSTEVSTMFKTKKEPKDRWGR